MTQFTTPNSSNPQASPIGSPVWDTVHALDAPEIWARNVLEGQWGALGIHPSNMTLAEREDLAAKTIQQDPDNFMNRLFSNLLTNPLVWLGVAMMTKAPFKGITNTFRVHEQMSPIVAEAGGFLNLLGLKKLKSGSHIFAGTSVGEILTFVERNKRHFDERHLRKLEEYTMEVLNRPGRTSNTFTDDESLLMGLKLMGADVTHKVPLTQVKDGKRITKWVENKAFVDGEILDRQLAEAGLDKLVATHRQIYDDIYQEVFEDPDTLLRIAHGIKRGALGPAGEGRVNDAWKMISDMIGDSKSFYQATDKMTETEIADFLKEILPRREQFYLPRNTHKFIHRKPDGSVAYMNRKELEDFEFRGELPKMLKGSDSALERQKILGPLDHDTISRIESLGLSGKNHQQLAKLREKSGKVTQLIEEGHMDGARLVSINANSSLQNYVDSMGRMKALYGTKIDDELANVLRQNDQYYAAREAKDLGFKQALGRKTGLKNATSADSLFTQKHGPSAFDALHRDYHAMVDHGDNFAKNALVNTYLPLATGTVRAKTAFFTNSIISTQQWVSQALEGGLGKIFDDAGLSKIKNGLESFTMKEFGPTTADRQIAKYFYNTTLGVNLGSVLINTTQIFNAARFTSVPAVGEGLSTALKKYSGYLNERMAGGTKFLGRQGEMERRSVLRKWFPDTEDIGIEDIDIDIERILRSPRFVAKDSLYDMASEGLLKVFSHGERFNRVATREIAIAHAKRQGWDVSVETIEGGITRTKSPEVRNFVKKVVDETQFTPTMLNTPQAFLNRQSFLNNPAFRQFMTFPIRQLTSIWMGGVWGEAAPNALGFLGRQDFWRTVGYSAIIYEAGKSMGMNLWEGTPLGSSTALYKDYGPFAPLPAPPAISVPFQITAALGGGDVEALKRTMPVLFPGGVALNRALGFLPGAGDELAKYTSVFEYADYKNRLEDGSVPVYSADGRLKEFMTTSQILRRATGFNRFGQDKSDEEMLDYFRKSGKRMAEMKRAYMEALYAGKQSKAAKVAKDYERAFGIKLVMSERQWDRFKQSKYTPRIERGLQSMDSAYAEMLRPELQRHLKDSHFSEARVEELRRKVEEALEVQGVPQSSIPSSKQTPFGESPF